MVICRKCNHYKYYDWGGATQSACRRDAGWARDPVSGALYLHGEFDCDNDGTCKFFVKRKPVWTRCIEYVKGAWNAE